MSTFMHVLSALFHGVVMGFGLVAIVTLAIISLAASLLWLPVVLIVGIPIGILAAVLHRE